MQKPSSWATIIPQNWLLVGIFEVSIKWFQKHDIISPWHGVYALCNFVFQEIKYGLHFHLKIIRLFLDCGWKLFLDSWFTWLFFCVFVNVLWKGLLVIIHNHTDCIDFFDLSALCDSKCLLKSSAWTDAKSHWLHLTGFSPWFVFKCLLKALVWEDA